MNDVSNRSCRAGSWLAVLGPEVTVLLPGGEKSRAAELWAAVDDGARLEVVLDALVSEGLRTLPDFVLVAASGDSARVIVRGTTSVSADTADGPVEITAGDLVWAERALTGVRSVVVDLPDSGAEGDELPALPGLARVGAVAWGSTGRSTDRNAARHAATRDPGPETVATAVAAQTSSREPEPAEPAEPAEPVAEAPVVEEPVVEEPVAQEPVVAPVVAPVVDEPAPAIADTGEQPTQDHDGMTQVGGQRLHPAPPGIPGQPQAPSVTSRPVARLVFSDGNTVEVDRAILVGRAPEARRFQPGDQPQLVTVPSPHQEVSSTHLEIRPGSGVDHGMAIATDLGSTNGTMLMQPGLPPEDLQPGIAVSLIPGAIVDLGDGVTIQVTKP